MSHAARKIAASKARRGRDRFTADDASRGVLGQAESPMATSMLDGHPPGVSRGGGRSASAAKYAPTYGSVVGDDLPPLLRRVSYSYNFLL